MNREIKTILDNLVVNGIAIPTAHLRYYGDSKTFVTWAILSENPSLFGNDEDLYSIVSVDVDVYSDSNYSSIMTEIKRRFKNNDWIWVEDSSEMFENETKLYHRTITFEKEKEIENG